MVYPGVNHTDSPPGFRATPTPTPQLQIVGSGDSSTVPLGSAPERPHSTPAGARSVGASARRPSVWYSSQPRRSGAPWIPAFGSSPCDVAPVQSQWGQKPRKYANGPPGSRLPAPGSGERCSFEMGEEAEWLNKHRSDGR